MRVVLTGGGTGGHIYPALSVAECLDEDELLYVGTADGPEAAIVPQHGVSFRSVPARKIGRRPTPGTLAAAAVSVWGVARGAALLRSWRPDVVLGTGGYASAGIMFAAAMLRIPTVVHEANAVPGRVNRLLARLCTRVAITFEASASYFPPEKTILTGLPVRRDLIDADPDPAREAYALDPARQTLLVSGGSGGAETLNRAVVQALPALAALDVDVVHQTGRAHYEGVRSSVGEVPSFYRPVPYVDNMPSLLGACALIVCRGGSSTLAEVTAVGLPAVVVPYPFAVADHQTGNARALADAGAAVLVRDADLTGAVLAEQVGSILRDPDRLDEMRRASRSLGRPEAAAKVAALLRDLAASRGRTAVGAPCA